MRPAALLLAAALSLAVTGCTKAAEDDAFGQKVRAYLLKHPEVIQEAVQKLQEKRDAEEAAATTAKLKSALPKARAALEHDPRDFVANPQGRVTVTEFYDYRCPHCINSAPAVLKIIKDNPDVRFVFKEMPIFGDTSEHAARMAIAVKNAGGDYIGFFKEAMSTPGLNVQSIDRIARARGIDPDKVEQGQTRTDADAQIAAVHQLATTLDIGGTPTFIVGDTLVPGEDMDAVRAAIAKAKAG
jgi:protein-disulfide isomerase